MIEVCSVVVEEEILRRNERGYTQITRLSQKSKKLREDTHIQMDA
jgi:hypothetical protein